MHTLIKDIIFKGNSILKENSCRCVFHLSKATDQMKMRKFLHGKYLFAIYSLRSSTLNDFSIGSRAKIVRFGIMSPSVNPQALTFEPRLQ